MATTTQQKYLHNRRWQALLKKCRTLLLTAGNQAFNVRLQDGFRNALNNAQEEVKSFHDEMNAQEGDQDLCDSSWNFYCWLTALHTTVSLWLELKKEWMQDFEVEVGKASGVFGGDGEGGEEQGGDDDEESGESTA